MFGGKKGNKINMDDQNNQLIGQNPINQSVQVPEKQKTYFWKIPVIILLALLLISGLYFFFPNKTTIPTVPQQTKPFTNQEVLGLRIAIPEKWTIKEIKLETLDTEADWYYPDNPDRLDYKENQIFNQADKIQLKISRYLKINTSPLSLEQAIETLKPTKKLADFKNVKYSAVLINEESCARFERLTGSSPAKTSDVFICSITGDLPSDNFIYLIEKYSQPVGEMQNLLNQVFDSIVFNVPKTVVQPSFAPSSGETLLAPSGNLYRSSIKEEVNPTEEDPVWPGQLMKYFYVFSVTDQNGKERIIKREGSARPLMVQRNLVGISPKETYLLVLQQYEMTDEPLFLLNTKTGEYLEMGISININTRNSQWSQDEKTVIFTYERIKNSDPNNFQTETGKAEYDTSKKKLIYPNPNQKDSILAPT